MKLAMTISIMLIIIISSTTLAEAQDTGAIEPGRKVRISSGDKLYTGTVISFSGVSIAIRSLDLLEEKSFSAGDISQVEAYMGKRSFWTRGVLIGAPAGGLLSYVASTGTIGTYTATDLVIFSSIGAVAGGLIGHLFKEERWEEVPLEKNINNSGLMLGIDGGYITLSYSF